jgi:branched-chain amino acid transport system ATP-binding protein
LTISGLVKASSGSIHFDGREVQNLPPHRIVGHGIVQVPEGREILATLTIKENLLLGAYRQSRHQADLAPDLENVLRLFPRLKERLDGTAGNLSGGEQQMLAIARALMARPRLLLLDEPSMGLAPLLVQEIFQTLRELNQRGLTIFLVEQNARQALKIADDAYVLETGKSVLSGAGAEMLNNPRIIQAYLGG